MPARVQTDQLAQSDGTNDLRFDVLALMFLAAFVALIYGSRLALRPLVGEETRWATGAREMLATGDWIVPRQQGHVFPERPPMTMWTMAIAGWLRGNVDPVAVRLPSVLAIVVTTLLIYFYTRSFASRSAATIAALVYATMGQVLQIGRLGESEALFTFLVSASLLLWHLGYARSWRPIVVWTLGFFFAGLAALVKGPQAPVYFIAITAVFLCVRRDWRYLISWQSFAGAAIFCAVVSAWQIPFYFATDWQSVIAIWSGLAGDRIHFRGILTHALTYPFETFACLLPWSPMLVALFSRETRRQLKNMRPAILFIAVAVGVAYPTVWLASGARTRYFMPLYPPISIVIGLVIERCSLATFGTYPRRAWSQFISIWAAVIAVSGVVVVCVNLIYSDPAKSFYQPRLFAFAFCAIAATAACVLLLSFRSPSPVRALPAVVAIATIAGLGSTGVMLNVHAARWNNPTEDVAQLRTLLPANAALVSFSPIEHRFAYYYGDPIAELDWPKDVGDVPQDAEYFCFMRQPGDTATSRAAGRGRSWYTTPGTLPFEWEELASICVERQVYDATPRTVVLGRMIKPIKASVSDATVPQPRRVGASHRSSTIR